MTPRNRPPVRNPRNKKGQVTTCAVCPAMIIGPAVYCSNACRQKAYRIRNAERLEVWERIREKAEDKHDPPLPG